jgi:glycogen(starch) synthase
MSRRAVAELRETFRPDVIHVHDPGAAAWLYLRTRDVNPRPVALTVHTTIHHLGDGASNSFGVMVRHADRIVAVSDAVRRELTRSAPERSHDIDVIRPAIPLAAPPSPVPLDPVRLLMVGRLVPQKGFDVGLHAFARVAASRSDVDLDVVGSGPEESALRHLAIALGIGDRVTWHGALRGTALARAFERATLLLMPSRYEGYPLVALEAAGHGRVVVATRAAGLDEAILDGTTGVLVPINDMETFAGAIEKLLADPPRISDMGHAARHRMTSEHSFERCVAAHEALYRRLVAH